jgi:hypothetical protein
MGVCDGIIPGFAGIETVFSAVFTFDILLLLVVFFRLYTSILRLSLCH